MLIMSESLRVKQCDVIDTLPPKFHSSSKYHGH